MIKRLSLPPKTYHLIHRYSNLKIGRHTISCPYYRNAYRNRGERPVFAGKGLPREIESETRKLLLNKAIPRASKKSILEIMNKARIGIDCSGLAVRAIEIFLQETKKTKITKILKPASNNPLSVLRYLLRPYMNISADMLTSDKNTVKVNNYNLILPGDLIRSGRSHVGVITEVHKKDNKTYEILFVHSLSDGKQKAGVRNGKIRIGTNSKPLEAQKWLETYSQNSMLKEYLRAKENDRGVRRLRFLASC